MMKIIDYIQLILFWITLISSSCVVNSEKENNDIESVVSEIYGKSIVFHDSLISYTNGEANIVRQFTDDLSERKIISVIEGNCSNCIRQFNKWIPFYNRLKSIGMENKLIFIVENIDPKFFMKYYLNDIFGEFILIYDEKDNFSRINNLPKNKMLKTLLVDSTNRVILVGNPLLDKGLMDCYYNEIQKK